MKRKKREYGEGSFKQLPSGSWRAFYSFGRDSEGKRVRLTFTHEDREKVKDWLREQAQLKRAGKEPETSKLTLGEWATQWLQRYKQSVSPKTYSTIEYRINRYVVPVLGHLPIAKLRPIDCQLVLTRMEGYSSSERSIAGKSLRYLLKGAVEFDLIRSNPALKIKLPKVEREEKHFLTKEQVKTLLEGAYLSPYYSLLVVAVDTGARIGELLGALWMDYDGSSLHIRRNLEELDGQFRLKEVKTKKSRRALPLSSLSRTALDGLRQGERGKGRGEGNGAIWQSERGGFIRKSNFIRRYWKPLLERLALPSGLRLYDLRHTCATLLLQSGVNVRVVSERLGHESIELTLKHYAHVLPSMQERASEVMETILPTIGTQTAQMELAGNDWII